MSKVEVGQRTPDIVFGLDHLPYLLDQTQWCFFEFPSFLTRLLFTRTVFIGNVVLIAPICSV